MSETKTTTFDSLQNVMSGMMTDRDKSSADRFFARIIDDAELEAMYRNDWITRKIVDAPAGDMVREWRAWQGDKDAAAAIWDAEQAFGIVEKVRTAKQWQRLFGGAALIIGDGSASPTAPLDVDRVRQGGIRYVYPVSRKRLKVSEINRDLETDNFGNPDFFQLTAGGRSLQVHHSRVVAFRGLRSPDTDTANDWWGDSVIQSVYDAIRHAARAAGGFSALIDEAIVDKVTTPELNAALTNPDDEKRFIKRYQLAATGKSLFKMLILGEGETWERQQINFTNFEPIMMAFLSIVSGASDIPATRMLGQSPRGLNATGESDLRNYYDMISSRQTSELGPEIRRFDEILKRHAIGPGQAGAQGTEKESDDLYFTWNSLWSMTPKEKSEVNLNNAKSAQIHSLLGVIDGEVMRKSLESQLIETGVYPGLEAALEEMEDEGREPAPLNFEEPAPEEPIGDAAPRTLYVSRPVKNAREIIAWAKKQGFKKTISASDLQVTIAFSRVPLDWFKASDDAAELTIEAGGPRAVEKMGAAVAVLFSSSRLQWRHREIIDIGGSHDFAEYQPHVSITFGDPPADIATIEPYRGKIVLGPEKFEPVDDGWRARVIEDARAREE